MLIKNDFFRVQCIFKVSLSVWSRLCGILTLRSTYATCRSVSPSCHVSLLLTLQLFSIAYLAHCLTLSYLSFSSRPAYTFLKWRNFCITRGGMLEGGRRGNPLHKQHKTKAVNNMQSLLLMPPSHPHYPIPILLSFAPYSQSQSRRQRVSCVKRPQKQFFLRYSYTFLKGYSNL